MTRSDLIDALAARFPALVRADAEAAVKLVTETLGSALAKGDRIEIRGFGSFEVKQRKPRLGRNPKTGAKVEVPAKGVPHFKAGKELRERVDYAPARIRKIA